MNNTKMSGFEKFNAFMTIVILIFFSWFIYNWWVAHQYDEKFRSCTFTERKTYEECVEEILHPTIIPLQLTYQEGVAHHAVFSALGFESIEKSIWIFWNTVYVRTTETGTHIFEFPLEFEFQDETEPDRIEPVAEETEKAEVGDLQEINPTPQTPSVSSFTNRICEPNEIQISIDLVDTIPSYGEPVNIQNIHHPQPQPGVEWVLTNNSECKIQVGHFFAINQDGIQFTPATYYSETNAQGNFDWDNGKTVKMYVFVPNGHISDFNGWDIKDILYLQHEYQTVKLGTFQHSSQSWYVVEDSNGPMIDPNPQPVFQAASVTISSNSFRIDTELTKDLNGNGAMFVQKPCDQNLALTIRTQELIKINGYWAEPGLTQIVLPVVEAGENCGSILLEVGEKTDVRNSLMKVDGIAISIQNQTHFQIFAEKTGVQFSFESFSNPNTYEDSWKGPFEIEEGHKVDFYLFQ